jgi:hypothetical protein
VGRPGPGTALTAQPAGDGASSWPRVSTATLSHGLVCGTAKPLAQGHRGGAQGIQRTAELVRTDPGGQGIRIQGDDGPDPHGPQVVGGGTGAPDPAAHGAVRDGELVRDEPVSAPAGGRDRGLPRSGRRRRRGAAACRRRARRG